MAIEAGDAFAIKINSHRQMWNGTICAKPTEWICGTAPTFRETHCAGGRENCFHLRVFAEARPRVLSPEQSVQSLLAENPTILDDQILFFYGTRFEPTRGVSVALHEQVIYGAYRVHSARIELIGGMRQVVIEPYADGWTIFPRNKVRKGKTPSAFDGVAYLAYTHQEKALEYIQTALDEANRLVGADRLSDQDMRRLVAFHGRMEEWLEVAAEKIQDHLAAPVLVKDSVVVPLLSYGSSARGESKLGLMLKEALAAGTLKPAPARPEIHEAPMTVVPTSGGNVVSLIRPSAELIEELALEEGPAAEAARPAQPTFEELLRDWKRPTLPEQPQASRIEAVYGASTLKAIRIATIHKPLVLFAGPPGVGKSHLASRLIDDAERVRTVILPVSSNWRGRDDLLGYVNPVSGVFEPTEFTRFLLRTQRAWQAGDRRMHVAICEEFNLSAPEHWLSDLLVRLEFSPSMIKDRTIHLGGTRIAGEDADTPTSIYLPPTLLIVGTLNNDHTGRKLSHRVMDRAALVEIEATARSALARAGVAGLPDGMEDSLHELNGLLEPLGVAFSVRSAKSLRDAISLLGDGETMSILDHVLVQEVLSKVRLNAGDMHDEKVVEALTAWTEKAPCAALHLCRERIAQWQDQLRRGRDVFQA